MCKLVGLHASRRRPTIYELRAYAQKKKNTEKNHQIIYTWTICKLDTIRYYLLIGLVKRVRIV